MKRADQFARKPEHRRAEYRHDGDYDERAQHEHRALSQTL
jgi:hypothetical protein